MKLRSRDFGDRSCRSARSRGRWFLNEAPKPRLRRCLRHRRFARLEPSSMKLRSRDFGDHRHPPRGLHTKPTILNEAPKPRLRRCSTARSHTVGRCLLNEAPKPRLRRYACCAMCSPPFRRSSMKLRSRDFGDTATAATAPCSCSPSSMKLRSRDFGDVEGDPDFTPLGVDPQ